jgi:cytoskeletal protein CcmA (bactofilin family)
MHADKVVIASGETLAETLVVSAESVRIEGRVEGDLVAMADRIRISGEVTGNVVVVGDEIDVEGVVQGSLYAAGDRVQIDGEVRGHVYAAAEDLMLLEAGRVGRDAATAGERVRIEGEVARDLFVAGRTIDVQGRIGRNLLVRGDEVTLLDAASVGGDFDARLPEGHAPEIAPGASIGGERIEGVLDHEGHAHRSRWMRPGFYMRTLVLMASAFLVGMLLHLVRPGLFEHALPAAADFFRELGLGFVTLVVTPVAIAIACVTVVGIPIGLMALFAFVTGLFLSGIVVAALLGQAVLGRRDESAPRFGVALLLGLVIVTVAVNLPFIGGLLRLVVLMTGTGMLVAHVRDSWRLRAV